MDIRSMAYLLTLLPFCMLLEVCPAYNSFFNKEKKRLREVFSCSLNLFVYGHKKYGILV
jgi:hypothetical protein